MLLKIQVKTGVVEILFNLCGSGLLIFFCNFAIGPFCQLMAPKRYHLTTNGATISGGIYKSVSE